MGKFSLLLLLIVSFLIVGGGDRNTSNSTENVIQNIEKTKRVENTMDEIIKNYVIFLKKYEEEIEINDYISQPLNTKKATKNEIEKTEKKLSITLPIELKNYYLNESNGTEQDSEKYAIYDERLDVFSHQRIIGIYDYFKMYWDSMDVDIDVVNEHISKDDMQFVNEKNREYFVFVADWSENFIETIVFDKNGNFYRFYFDQDVHIIEYINEMINGSNSMQKSTSFIKLLGDYLEEEKEEIKESL